ncbi:MAG: DUF4340 domain-containing protein [Cyclobacteriaceae bacterium]|nr:DUF4340 domain-containing protein [Cyclobacteriaceae bacterium]
MSGNFSTKHLLIILVAVATIYAVLEFTGGESRSGSLRATLVDINQDKATKLMVTKSGQTTVLEKSDEEWALTLPSGKKVKADEKRIADALSALTGINPDQLASRKKEKWAEYSVDSAGTRVQVFEGEEATLDIIIGRFGMKSQNQFHTYVRLQEDEDVYVADNFMSFSIPTDHTGFRNGDVLELNTDSLASITFTYPADSSFSLQKTIEGNWALDGVEVDSTAMAGYLSKIAFKGSSSFFDDQTPEQLGKSHFEVSLLMQDSAAPVVIKVFQAGGRQVLHSTQNPESLFADDGVVEEVFVGRGIFGKGALQ